MLWLTLNKQRKKTKQNDIKPQTTETQLYFILISSVREKTQFTMNSLLKMPVSLDPENKLFTRFSTLK